MWYIQYIIVLCGQEEDGGPFSDTHLKMSWGRAAPGKRQQ